MMMSAHWSHEEIERFADGEPPANEEHLRTCVACANAVIAASRMKRAIRAAMETGPAPEALRRRIAGRQPAGERRAPAPWWMAMAAAVAIAVIGGALLLRLGRQSTLAEMADMHVTMLASATPVDVVSTDRHTVKPWFEGRVPFTVPVPDLTQTPFRLIGGRVVYVAGRQAAYLLVAKGAHRISLFILNASDAPSHLAAAPATVSTLAWRHRGLAFVAVADVPEGDLAALRSAFRQ